MQIVGMMLVRNEAFFVEWALRNALNFCDTFIVCDHQSSDATSEILMRLRDEFPEKIKYASIQDPRESHDLLKPYAGTDTWVFAVDGDEIYDPEGLRLFRRRLEQGEFNQDWVIFGNVLNVVMLNKEEQTAKGYLAPPSRSMTKLFNFSAIDGWDGKTPERLHGGKIRFRSGYHLGLRKNLHDSVDWENAVFRCLHLCFIPRSAGDKTGEIRANIMDRHAWSLRKIMSSLIAKIKGKAPARWKEEKYARGNLVQKDIRAFLPQKERVP